MKFFKSVQLFLVAILIIGLATPISTEAAVLRSGDLMKINKTVSNNTVVKGETTDVTLTVKGTPKDSTFVKPNDVVLIIDKSGSMANDNRMAAAKVAAKEFIDLMDLTKHELGIVDYQTSAKSFALTTDKNAAKAYVDTIQLGGGTNTSAAIAAATSMLSTKRPDAQPTIVIMTDGAADSAPAARAAAQAAKDAGITFYSIALLGPNENPDTSEPNKLLKEMASSFDHHHFVLGSVGLSDVYKAIVEEIGLASAYNVTITDTISPEFELVPGSYDHHIPKPTVTGNKIEWFISELKTNELSFTYQVRAKVDATAGKYPVAQTSTTFEMGDSSIYSLNTTNPIVEIKNHAPIITSVTEDKGLTTGGETVTIAGQHFLPQAKVYFGTTLATIVSVTDNEIVVTTPVGVQGPVVVKVQNPDLQFALGDFTYYAIPTISSISPTEGPLEGGNKIFVYGTNFMNGVKVYIDDVEAVTTFVTSGRVVAVVPAVTDAKIVHVKVVNPDNTSAELVDAYTYLAPPPPPPVKILSLSVDSGELQGGEKIFVYGENFDRDMKVYFGDTLSPLVTFVTSNRVQVTVPAAVNPGSVSVKVENPDGASDVLVDAYTYLAPPPPPAIKISSLSVDSGELQGGEKIFVYGENFDRNLKVYFGDTLSPLVTFVTSNRVQVTVPAAVNPGSVSVKVENPDGASDVLVDAYTYLAPPPPPAIKISSLSVDLGKLQGGEKIFVYGENFDRNMKVYFGDTLSPLVTFVTNNRVQVTVPAAVNPGSVSVKVENPDGASDVLVDAYEYLAPPVMKVTSLSTTSGEIKGGTSVTISGENFVTGAKVYFGDTLARTSLLSSSSLRATAPAATNPGFVTVKVENPDGMTDELTDAFEYITPPPLPAPEIISLAENSIVLGQGKTIMLYGKNMSATSKVYFNDQLLKSVILSSEQLKIVIPVSLIPGSVDVKLVNEDGQTAILANGFTYTEPVPDPAPIILALSSNVGSVSGNEIITITGEHFTSGAKVYFGNTNSSIISISPTEIKVKVPATAISGTVSVKVVNPDQQEALLQDAYTYEGLKPTITGLSVDNGPLAGGAVINVYGTNFNGNMIVTVDGKTANFSIISVNQIRVRIPAGTTIGPVDLMVNLYGETATVQYTYN